MRYDEATGMYVGVPRMLPMRPWRFDASKLTEEQKIRWALAYLASLNTGRAMAADDVKVKMMPKDGCTSLARDIHDFLEKKWNGKVVRFNMLNVADGIEINYEVPNPDTLTLEAVRVTVRGVPFI